MTETKDKKREPYDIVKANKKLWEEIKSGRIRFSKRIVVGGAFGKPKFLRPENTPKSVKVTSSKVERYQPNFFDKIKNLFSPTKQKRAPKVTKNFQRRKV